MSAMLCSPSASFERSADAEFSSVGARVCGLGALRAFGTPMQCGSDEGGPDHQQQTMQQEHHLPRP
eukprot:4096571-Alexandrium_andersonii.AAC.1